MCRTFFFEDVTLNIAFIICLKKCISQNELSLDIYFYFLLRFMHCTFSCFSNFVCTIKFHFKKTIPSVCCVRLS